MAALYGKAVCFKIVDSKVVLCAAPEFNFVWEKEKFLLNPFRGGAGSGGLGDLVRCSARCYITWTEGRPICPQILILAEGLKIKSFLALSGRESSLVQTFCESCVHLDITHPSVHMTRRFVIQGCPTLKSFGTKIYFPLYG